MTAVVPDGWGVVALASVGSTMDEARRLAAAGAADRTVVRAGEQTGGRGRLGRAWTSPPGNVYATAILRPSVPVARASELSLVVAVAAADAVAAFAGRVGLKWPNDVLLDGGKVAGILLEAMSEGTALTAVLAGIGINVASAPEIAGRATARVPGTDADRVFGRLLLTLDARLREWEQGGLEGVRAAWLARGPALGSPVAVGQGTEVLHGAFDGLETGGALRLRLGDGTLRRIASGEILERGAS